MKRIAPCLIIRYPARALSPHSISRSYGSQIRASLLTQQLKIKGETL
jgi:hypothetical protein